LKIIELDHYNLKAPAELLAELKVFYTEVIGLQEGFRPKFRSSGIWLYASDRALLHLTEAELAPGGVNGAFNHIAFKCVGLEQMVAKLDRLSIEYTVSEVQQLGQTQLFLKDPAGVGVELNFSEIRE
jgi:catechol-2,3-dioxygenase